MPKIEDFYVCEGCGYETIKHLRLCPNCGGTMRKVVEVR